MRLDGGGGSADGAPGMAVELVPVVVVVVSDEIEMGWGVARTAACQLKTVLRPRVAFVLKWLEEMIEALIAEDQAARLAALEEEFA